MEDYNKIWRFFFAISLVAIAGQQLYCADFRPLIMTPWAAWMPGRLIWTWICSAALIAVAIAIILEIKARAIALVTGVVFLLFVLIFHIPYQAGNPQQALYIWSDAFKLLAYSGGCFIIAESLPNEPSTSGFINHAAKLIPLGKYFFCTTMIVFGIEHFIYPTFVATLVPNWIPWHMFWTYFGGFALILAGLAIISGSAFFILFGTKGFTIIRSRPAATLLGAMILIWFLVLHIPRAIIDPYSGNGNEWTSVFESLGFSGIAFLIASNLSKESVQQMELADY